MFEYLSVIDANESGISPGRSLVTLTHAHTNPNPKNKNKKEIEFYVTVTKRNLISFRFIRLYNFRKILSLCVHNNGCSKHCCYTTTDIIAASAVAAATVCLTYIQVNVSTTPTNVCNGGFCNA